MICTNLVKLDQNQHQEDLLSVYRTFPINTSSNLTNHLSVSHILLVLYMIPDLTLNFTSHHPSHFNFHLIRSSLSCFFKIIFHFISTYYISINLYDLSSHYIYSHYHLPFLLDSHLIVSSLSQTSREDVLSISSSQS